MKKYWKLFEELVIGLKDDPFVGVRLKLTVIYTIVIIIAIGFYLILLNKEFNEETVSFAKETISDNASRQRFLRRSAVVIQTTLFTIQSEDVSMFFLTIGISYILAGIALRPLRKSMQAQKQFLADASHELKTPLTIVKTEMEVFLRDKRNWVNSKRILLRRKDAVESNLEEIGRMEQIVGDLLILSRTNLYADDYRFSSLDLRNILYQVLKRIKNTAKKKHMSFKLTIDGPVYVKGDFIKLEQALMNIVKNAITYTKSGGKVEITVTKNDKTVEITVIDTGVGISKKELVHITKRFFRSDMQFVKRTDGTGLGLAIANTIIKRHKGTLHVESILGKGTEITIVLPIVS